MELQAQTALCNMNVVDGTKVGSAQMETPAHWLRFQANLRLCVCLCVSPLCVSLCVSLFVHVNRALDASCRGVPFNWSVMVQAKKEPVKIGNKINNR